VLEKNRSEYPEDPFFGLDNVMLRDADEVVDEVKLEQVLSELKDHAYIGLTSDQKKGDLFRYALTQMDEEDLAAREYRDGGSGKSLGQFAEEDGEPDIYEQYIQESKAQRQGSTEGLKQQV
jgi:hypothetical protein